MNFAIAISYCLFLPWTGGRGKKAKRDSIECEVKKAFFRIAKRVAKLF
jgi:hypothetical protein